jgi:hypothetical protein
MAAVEEFAAPAICCKPAGFEVVVSLTFVFRLGKERAAQPDVAHREAVRVNSVCGFRYHGLILFSTESSL